MKEALFYQELENEKVRCELCPHFCTINPGKTGNCKVRKNINGKLYSESYGKISGYHLDPIEKKPLYHFYPGKNILSFGSVGCNLHCKFCQNHEIAQSGVNDVFLKELSPDSIANDALRRQNNIGIAYTYNEPLVSYEFMRDTALLARQLGLKNVMVTNGFFSPSPLQKLFTFIDAFNVDLKAFTDDFYKKLTTSDLKPVKEALCEIKKSGIHFEITNLIIPEFNDNADEFKRMVDWICSELGDKTVLHLSRYFPRYKLDNPATPKQKMVELYNMAVEKLKFVYIGNIDSSTGQNTFCPQCRELLIRRFYYEIQLVNLNSQGNCSKCNYKVIENL
ncbi:MAG: AmmeMemoRadiSam system radical SAM enzyme [Bacteroidales bacterium]